MASRQIMTQRREKIALGAETVDALAGRLRGRYFARDHKLLLSIRGGGHNVSGSALADGGVVIDLTLMRSVHVMPEKRVAWVESGALLGDLDHETAPFALAAPMGVVSETAQSADHDRHRGQLA